MNNPLYRKMFQQPGMSRQPMGILASSPQLANTVQQRQQPVRMAQGGLNTTSFTAAVQRAIQSNDRYALKELADPNNYGEAAKTQDGQNAIQMAAQAINRAAVNTPPTQVSTAPTVQTAGSLASPPVMSVRGSGDTVALKAAPPMMSYDGPSQGALERQAALSDAPSKIMEGLKRGIADIKTGFTDATAPKGPVSAGTGKPSYASPAEIRAGINSFIGNTLLGPKLRGKFFAEDIKDFEPNVDVSNPFDDPSDFVPEGPGETMADIAVSRDTVGTDGSDTAGDGVLATTTPTQDAAKQDAEKTAKATKPKATTGVGLLQSVYGGTTKTSDLTAAFEADIKNIEQQFLTGITENREATIDAGSRVKLALDKFEETMSAKRAKGKDFSLEDVRDEALKISGIDETDYDDNRKDAFWMGLMRAGLAIAAGESDNALSNIAKGLGIGLEGYGKDIATLNEQEREDRKELRAISMDLIKTKEAKSAADAASENDFNYQQQRIAQAAVQGADQALLAAQNREATHKLTGQRMQAELAYQLNTAKRADATQAADQAYKNFALQISMLPEEAKQAMMIEGNAQIVDGQFKLTTQGETYYKKLIEAGSKSKYPITDLDKKATAAADVGNIFGVKLSDDKARARNQAINWEAQYQTAYDKAAGTINEEETRAKLLADFEASLGGQAAPANSAGGGKLSETERAKIAAAPDGSEHTIDGKVFIKQGSTLTQKTGQ